MSTGPQLPAPAWLVGCGNMAGAIVDGWRLAGVDLSNAVVIRPSGTPVAGIRTVTRFADAGPPPRFVMLGIKPQQLDAVTPELANWVTSRTILVSMLAGVEVEALRRRFPRAAAVIRIMPNLPVAVRRGVVAVFGDADAETRTAVEPLFAALGYAIWTHTEAQHGAVGSVAGAGPAYVARFVDALTASGIETGLSAETAATVALETVLGTTWLASAQRIDMETLARRVASPAGTTQAGLDVLDPELRGLMSRTFRAADAREAELAAQARSPAFTATDVGEGG